jgi:hypothetical protein
MPVDLIELFKTPAVSAIIAAGSAIVSASLTQILNRKATERQFLREQRGQAYSDLFTSFDGLVNTLLRVSANATPENQQDFKTASDRYSRARSVADLYAPASIGSLLKEADQIIVQTVGSPNWHLKAAMALAVVRQNIVQSAREHLGNTT